MNAEKLFKIFKQRGADRKRLTRELIGMIPEINYSRIYEKKGFDTIFDCALMLAGLSFRQVKLVLSLDKHFKELLILRGMLRSGEVSINKLARITSVVTKETEKYWAKQLKILTKSALEVAVRDAQYEKTKSQNSLVEPLIEPIFLPGQKINKTEPEPTQATKQLTFEDAPINELNLEDDVYQKLLAMQKKGIDVNQFLRESLTNREAEIEQEKEEIAAERQPTDSHYINVRIKEVKKKEAGTKCEMEACSKPAEELHHTIPFAMNKTHNPKYLAQLCKQHHLIAQTINVKFVQERHKATKSG